MYSWCKVCTRIYYAGLPAERRSQYRISRQVRRLERYHSDPVFRARTINDASAYSARRRGASGDYSYAEWCYLLELCGNACVACGLIFLDPEKLTRDHIVPVTKGGSNLIENLQPLCGPCNSAKGNRIPVNYLIPRGIVLDPARLAKLKDIARLSPLERCIRDETPDPDEFWQAG